MKRLEAEIVFETEEDFIKHVQRNNLIPRNEKEGIIEHEKDHYDKAKKLGYSPKYFFKLKGRSFNYAIILDFEDDEKVYPSHLVEIAGAPSNLSELDKKMILENLPRYR